MKHCFNTFFFYQFNTSQCFIFVFLFVCLFGFAFKGLSSNAFLNCPFAQCLRDFYPVIINPIVSTAGWVEAMPSFVK